MLTKVIEKIKQLLGRFAGALSFLGFKISSLLKGRQAREYPGKGERSKASNALEKTVAFLNNKTSSLAERFFGRFPEGNRKSMLIAAGGLAALLLIVVISVLAGNLRNPQSGSSKKNAPAQMCAELPGYEGLAGELFIPNEPDFVPEFILEREPRRSWSIDDIRPYWKNPLQTSGVSGAGSSSLDASEKWREEIKSAVDKLMEAVP